VHAVHGSEAPEQPDVYVDPPHGYHLHANVVEEMVRVKAVTPGL
jgi:hypothetical protein